MLESLKPNESFTYKKLSADEMSARRILGRLVGPCADFTIPTRNGRKYNESLWNRVFEDEIVQEKIANKCLFGELGHPLDREEVDPEKIAIALNELPKKNADGQLIACFDILDTPSGKILKTLCDYGTTIGISSRGTGDIIQDQLGEEIVDPETYCFECFDAVILPAVKAARLNYMTESVDTATLKMRKSLTEELAKASVEDRKTMLETLDALNIKLDSEKLEEDEDTLPGGTPVDPEDIPWGAEDPEESKVLVEDSEEPEADEDGEVEESEEAEEEVDDEVEDEEEISDYEKEVDEESEESSEITIAQVIEQLDEFDPELPFVVKPTVIDGVEYNVELSFEDNDGELNVGVICEPIEVNNDDTELPAEEIEAEEIAIEEAPIEEEAPEAEEAEEEAEDNGDAEVLESLKELIRQKELLESEIKTLKSEKTVSDAKVEKLEEDLNKYKAGFARVSEIAKKANEFEKEVQTLIEQVAHKNTVIKKLEAKVSSSVTLTENLTKDANKVTVLNEQLNACKKEKEALEATYKAEVAQCKTRLKESVEIAKTYKNKCAAILTKYIESKANMLGVKTSEITNRLNENYTLNDIDKICDDLLSYNVSMNRLPFGTTRNQSIRIKESTAPKPVAKKIDPSEGYEIDDSLLELAGLKK